MMYVLSCSSFGCTLLLPHFVFCCRCCCCRTLYPRTPPPLSQRKKYKIRARLEELEEERASQQTRLESAVGAREAAEQRAAALESRLHQMSAEVAESTSLLEAKDKQLAEVDAERVELAAREQHLSQLVDVSLGLPWRVFYFHPVCVAVYIHV